MTEVKTKRCKQCGEIKPLDRFRSYYQGRKGTYTICKDCERINSRYKYICSKASDDNEAIQAERQQIEKLYELQRANGLRPPKTQDTKPKPVSETVSSMIAKYEATAQLAEGSHCNYVPLELREWLTRELTEDPDYYFDEIYEHLVKVFRPILRIDKDTMLPVYDDTWRDALNKVLDRFNEYEDEYYKKLNEE